MKFNDIYNNFKINILKIINTKKFNDFVLPEETRNKLLHYLSDTENDFLVSTNEINEKINKLDTTIYIEYSSLEEKLQSIKNEASLDSDNINAQKEAELEKVLNDFNEAINNINLEKTNFEKQTSIEIENINQAIRYEIEAYDHNVKYYDNLILNASKKYDEYNSIIFNKIINIDSNQPKTPKFNPQRKKFNNIITNFSYQAPTKVNVDKLVDSKEFIEIINEYSNPLDDIITSLEDHSHFQTRIDNLNDFLENMVKEFSTDKNRVEKIKHEVSAEYNRKLYSKNQTYNENVNASKGTIDRKLKSIDKRVEKQKKDYSEESARISEDYVSHITNISNEINNLDNENKRLIDNYNREYYFTYYKTLFEYNNLVSSIRDKTGYSVDYRNRYEQKRLDNFEIKAYQQKLKSLKLKHDKYVEQLNLNIIKQINHNNYEIIESNLYKTFDLTTSKIKHESFLKKSKLLKDNIEKNSLFSYTINSLKNEKEIVKLRFQDYDNKRQELDYEIEKMEIEHRARRLKIEKKIAKYEKLKDEYLKFVEADNALIKAINDSNHNSKLTIYYFEIRKNNILKKYNENILKLAKERANAIKDYKLSLYTYKINKLKDNLVYYLDECDLKLKYYTHKYDAKVSYVNEKYDVKLQIVKNNYNKNRNLKAIMFERNTFRHDNLKTRHYSDYVFTVYSLTNILHMTMVDIINAHPELLNNLNMVFINFYSGIVTNYYQKEQYNLEKRLNDIYYYKNSVSIKKLNLDKEKINQYYDIKINNLTLINNNYIEKLNLFTNEKDKINQNTKNVNKVKRLLVKSIKNNNNELKKLAEEKREKLDNIDFIILKNKRSSIIHYQNYHIFKKTMDKSYNRAIKNINSIEHKSKKKLINTILDEHCNFIKQMKKDVYRIFKNFTSRVEGEFPKETKRTLNNYNHLCNVYDDKLNKSLAAYNKESSRLYNELKKNSKTPKHKNLHNTRIYIHNIKQLEAKHNRLLDKFQERITILRKNLVNDEFEVSNLISDIQTNNKTIVRYTEAEQQKNTYNYIATIKNIKLEFNNDIFTIDRNKTIEINELHHKYDDITHSLKEDKNSDTSKLVKEIKFNENKQKEVQRIYKKNLSNIDADLINDRVDQQIILSQKLKKLKHLFIKNKDLRTLEDSDYQIVSLSNYDEVNNKIE